MIAVGPAQTEVISAQILVVDDELPIRQALRRALSLKGYQVDEADCGATALALLESGSYDLVLLDVHMPGMDGAELMRRARQVRPDVLMIVLTGHATVDSAVTALKMSAADYLLKPISLGELAQVVHSALRSRAEQQYRHSLLQMMGQAIDALRTVEIADAPAVPQPEIEERAPVLPVPGRPAGAARFVCSAPVTLDRQQRTATVSGNAERVCELSDGECGILAALMQHRDQVLCCSELARLVWNYQLDEIEAQGLIRAQIFRLRRKLEVDAAEPQLIHTIRGRGYLFSPR